MTASWLLMPKSLFESPVLQIIPASMERGMTSLGLTGFKTQKFFKVFD
uniref:Uncharacterized protein n=1 Tax=Anguilla anguilla TaxID=7936 RepID=A0A0E9QDL1_ANGAN